MSCPVGLQVNSLNQIIFIRTLASCVSTRTKINHFILSIMVNDTTDTFIKWKCSLRFSCSIILVTIHYVDGSLRNHSKYKFQTLFPGIHVPPWFGHSLVFQPHHLLFCTWISHSYQAVLFQDWKSTGNISSHPLCLGKLYPSLWWDSTPPLSRSISLLLLICVSPFHIMTCATNDNPLWLYSFYC